MELVSAVVRKCFVQLQAWFLTGQEDQANRIQSRQRDFIIQTRSTASLILLSNENILQRISCNFSVTNDLQILLRNIAPIEDLNFLVQLGTAE